MVMSIPITLARVRVQQDHVVVAQDSTGHARRAGIHEQALLQFLAGAVGLAGHRLEVEWHVHHAVWRGCIVEAPCSEVAVPNVLAEVVEEAMQAGRRLVLDLEERQRPV